MRTPATLNSMHGRVSSRLSLSSSSCSPHRCFAQIHYKVDWLRSDATIFYWFDTTIATCLLEELHSPVPMARRCTCCIDSTAFNANHWPISLVRLGSSFAIDEIMSVTQILLLFVCPFSSIPVRIPSPCITGNHPHT